MKLNILAAIAIVAAASCTQNKQTLLSVIVPADSTEPINVVIRECGVDTLVTPEAGKTTIALPVDKMSFGAVVYNNEHVSFIPDGEAVTVDFVNVDSAYFAMAQAKKGANVALAGHMKWMYTFIREYQKVKTDEALVAEKNKEYLQAMKGLLKEDNALALEALQDIQAELSYTEVREIIAGLTPDVKNHKVIAQMMQTLDLVEGTSAGKMFTDFEIPQPDGTVIKLSDYVGKGKYILVDFWASWCGPCKKEIPNIKKVYDKYHGPKFDVVSVAVWDKVADTQAAIKEKALEWNQIIDAKAIPTDLYGIKGIPELILFGPDGTILERGELLRGANMEPTIASYLDK